MVPLGGTVTVTGPVIDSVPVNSPVVVTNETVSISTVEPVDVLLGRTVDSGVGLTTEPLPVGKTLDVTKESEKSMELVLGPEVLEDVDVMSGDPWLLVEAAELEPPTSLSIGSETVNDSESIRDDG